MDIEVAKQANKIIKGVLERLDSVPHKKADYDQYKDVPEIFNNASGMINDNKTKAALLNVWMASQATNAIFLLWRREIEHADLEKEWRALPTTDELAQIYEDLLKEENKVADKIEAERREYMEGQHDLDIFKGVLNGMDKDKAEAEYKKMQEQMTQTQGK